MNTTTTTLTYPDCGMAELVFSAASQYPANIALDFYGCKLTFAAFTQKVRDCARALLALGVKPKDRFLICMPNTPSALITLYAVNLIGAVACMIHPLSAEEEIAFYLKASGSRFALTMNRFYPKFEAAEQRSELRALIITDIEDGLSGIKKPLYLLSDKKRRPRIAFGKRVIRYSDFLEGGRTLPESSFPAGSGGDDAVILYSGGTTGKTKGIVLTNLNLNALALQTQAGGDCIVPGHKMLAIMPVFHGFGLGVCVHTALVTGVTAILVPQFSVAGYYKLLKKHRPHYIAGVPTLFEALLRIKNTGSLDLSSLEGVFSGGDSLSEDLRERVDVFFREHGAGVQIREGYGLTECVTASCLTPKNFHKKGSIGVPFPDMYYKITAPGSVEALPAHDTGEICISGPTVMRCYDNDEAETALALRLHPDGRIWLHTGDLGYMDEDGFVYFRGRIKRLIITSGYSVYPAQIEAVLDSHSAVKESCAIGVPDPYKIHRIKAFVVLNEGYTPSAELQEALRLHCAKSTAKYALPAEFEFIESLPRTLISKVDYRKLEGQ